MSVKKYLVVMHRLKGYLYCICFYDFTYYRDSANKDFMLSLSLIISLLLLQQNITESIKICIKMIYP